MTQHPETPGHDTNDPRPTTSGEERLHRALQRLRIFPHPSRRIQILEILQHRCSLEDLRNLCFYLGLDYDMLPGDRKMAKARSLIDHYDRRDNLAHLITQLVRIRPDLEGDL